MQFLVSVHAKFIPSIIYRNVQKNLFATTKLFLRENVFNNAMGGANQKEVPFYTVAKCKYLDLRRRTSTELTSLLKALNLPLIAFLENAKMSLLVTTVHCLLKKATYLLFLLKQRVPCEMRCEQPPLR